ARAEVVVFVLHPPGARYACVPGKRRADGCAAVRYARGLARARRHRDCRLRRYAVAMADKRKDKGQPNVVAIGDAERKLPRMKGGEDPPPHEPRDGIPAAKWPGARPDWQANKLGLPTGEPGSMTVCPVEPIGIEGELYHLVDSARQFRSIKASDFSHAGMQ